MLGLRVTTYTHCLPPPLLILDFSSLSSSIFVCLMSLPDGITDILNPAYSVSVSMPFSNQDCCACPFVIIIGKKGPRDAQIDHLGARLIPLCPTVRWQPYYLMTGQLPCQNIDPSSCQLVPCHQKPEFPGCGHSSQYKGIVMVSISKKKKNVLFLRIRLYRPTERRAAEKGWTQYSSRSLGKKRGWTTPPHPHFFLCSYNHVFFFWGYSTIWRPLIQSVC